MKQRGFNHPPPRLTADTLHSQKRAVAASLLQACYLVVIKPISGHVRISCSRLITRFLHIVKGGFSFFLRRGGNILGGVQVIYNMPFLMLQEGHEMANQSAPGG